jgi:threonine dehydratase
VTSSPTPLEEHTLAGRQLLLKREDSHELGAFKWRGALPVLEGYARDGAQAVVTASTGNHGAATAWAAARLGLEAVVYAPAAASRAKLTLIRNLGAEIRQTGADLDEAKEEGRAHASRTGQPFFEDGAERGQYDGYGAIGDEILAQTAATPAAIVVPLGNGALLGGIGLAISKTAPDVERVGVGAKEAPVMVDSWASGRPVLCDRSETFADGLAVRVAIPLAVEVLGEVATRMLTVSERRIAEAVAEYAEVGIRAEGAAAAALAAVPELDDVGDPLVLIVTGRNIDDELFTRALEQPSSFPD